MMKFIKYVVLTILALIAIGYFVSLNEPEPYRPDLIGFIYEAPLSLGEPDPAEEFREKYGSPETLEGTDNTTWVVYWSKGDFTTLIKKSNMEIYSVVQGRIPLNQ